MTSLLTSLTAPLTCHPSTACPAVESVVVQVGWKLPTGEESNLMLLLAYVLTGDLGQLRLPLPRPPAPADELWRHTCFEAFVATSDDKSYREYNFSPSGEWAVYRFRGYRDRMHGEAGEPAPRIALPTTARGLKLAARIVLPPGLMNRPLRLALSAVLEDRSGGLSYWALRHPPGKPDFHHPDGFTLALGPPRNPAREDPR